MPENLIEIDPPPELEVASFYADERTTYLEWVSRYGKEEADRLADRAGIPSELRKSA